MFFIILIFFTKICFAIDKETLHDDVKRGVYDNVINNDVTNQNLPTIDEIIDKINTKIANDKVGKSSNKPLNPINKDKILKLLYLYTKDLKYKNYKINDLVKEILLFNNISLKNLGIPLIFLNNN